MGNKIQPTPYADSLAASAEKILEATDEFLAVATDLSSKSVKGTFRVAVASTFNVGETIAQKRLQQLKSLLEHATMEITEHTNKGCISLVQEGMADIAIGIGRFELPGLIVEPVKNLEIALAVSSDNPLASLNCITAKELLSLTLAMPMNTSALLPSLQKFAKKHRTELAPFAPVQIRKSQREEFLLSGGGILIEKDSEIARVADCAVALDLAPDIQLSVPLFVARREHESGEAARSIAEFLRGHSSYAQ